MTTSLLEQLVEYRGIESNYNDAWGRPTTIDPSTKSKLLSAMGYQVNEPDLLLKQVQDNSTKTWLSVLNPVQDLSLSLANVAKGKRSLGQNLRFASSRRSGLQLSVPME